jgi:hypothetical protein
VQLKDSTSGCGGTALEEGPERSGAAVCPRLPTVRFTLHCRHHCTATNCGSGPGADSCTAVTPHSFDDLVGAQQDRGRQGQAEQLGGLKIDDHFELGRLLDRQLTGLGALQNFVHEGCRTAI